MNKKEYKLEVETGKFNLNMSPVELKVKRGELSFGWLLVAYNIMLTIFVGIVSIIPYKSFLAKLVLIILGSIFIFKFCLFNQWFRNKVIGIFSKAKETEEVSNH